MYMYMYMHNALSVCVSTILCRLSVRNIPTQMKEVQLREIFNSSIDAGKITQVLSVL